jgi:hypothetical protein
VKHRLVWAAFVAPIAWIALLGPVICTNHESLRTGMRPAADSHSYREQPLLSVAGQGLEGYVDAKTSCNAANCSIALAGMLPDSVAVKK